MEAILLRGHSLDHKPATPHKSHIRLNPNNKNNSSNPYISSRQYGSNHMIPPPQYFHNMTFSQSPHYNRILTNSSYPPPYSLQQPPLLPLPAANATISRGLSFLPTPPPNKKPNNRKKQSKSPTNNKTHRKSSSPKKSPSSDVAVTVSSARVIPNGPDESINVATNVFSISVDSNSLNINGCVKAADDSDDRYGVFSGSAIFALSPPPSSLPLPSFSLRSKLISCKAEVTGVDGGATVDLRRLLQLR